MKQALRRVPIKTGNLVAWFMLAASFGFIIGWILGHDVAMSACFPVV